MRQCGKTHCLNEFGRRHYGNVAYFSFENNERLAKVFDGDMDPARIVRELEIRFNLAIDENTLIIFDEIQFCGRALTSLKYFAENAPRYHIACASSLPGVKSSEPSSFPVGKVEFMTLRPMNFYEFMMACGKDRLCAELKNHDTEDELPASVLEMVEELRNEYMFVGGMPAAVKSWVVKRDPIEVSRILRNIIDAYELDFAKHAPSAEKTKIFSVWNDVPAQLSKENRRFFLGHAVEGARARTLEDSVQWLIDAGLIFKVNNTEKPSVPLAANSSPRLFKLYLCDVGLMAEMLHLPAELLLYPDNAGKDFKGFMAENFVLTEIVSAGYGIPLYWTSKGRAEIDFLIMSGRDIVPIEVKSGSRFRAASLAEYIGKYDPRVAVLVSGNNIRGGDVKHVPLGMVWRLGDFLGGARR